MIRRPIRRDDGFTLVELLVVIVVLGVLATITVFAVRGLTDKAAESAQAADEHILVTAEEAHQARFNSYAIEADLVTVGLLTSESSQLDIALEPDGTAYTIVPEGSGTSPTTVPPATTTPPAPPAAVATTVAGFDGESFGTGVHRVVVISDSSSWSGSWASFVAGGASLATTEVILLGAGDVRTTADVDAIVATGATYVIAPSSIAITGPSGGTFVGQYLSETVSANQFWWGHTQGNSLTAALDHYRTAIVPGG